VVIQHVNGNQQDKALSRPYNMASASEEEQEAMGPDRFWAYSSSAPAFFFILIK